jgi:exopolyphosphatase/guanosine-5'-triphosphate,3'-diphosphate pyrophosphatase
MKIKGMSDLRADMIVVAIVLLRWVINNSSFEDIRISHYAMKEGILFQHLNCGENEYI